VRGIGINMHNSYYGSGYTNDVPLVESLVTSLGVGIVRDGFALGQKNVCQEDATLGAAGIRFDFIASPTQTASDIASWLACVGTGYVASIEGPNEYDASHPPSDPDWQRTLTAEQQLIAGTVRANDPGVSVIGPSVTTVADAQSLGDLSAFLDDGNAHVYFNGYNPGNTGYGNGGYGSIAYDLTSVAPVSANKPIAVTETGYGTAGGAGQVSEATQAKYLPRLLLDLKRAGVGEMIPYELIDEGGSPFSNYGLVRSDLSTKPAYYAIKGMLGILHDSGTATGTLGIAFSGQTQNVATQLFRKSDGSYVLAMWLEVQSCNPNTGADVPVATQSVTAQFTRPLVTPSLYTFDGTSQYDATPLVGIASFTLEVSDAVQFFVFR
jgi:hypothetical protein